MEARCRRILSGEPLRVLFVGTLCFRKGMLDMASILRGRGSQRFRFRFVGPVSKEAREFVRDLDSRAEFIPKQPQHELSASYAWGDLFAFPTIEDGFAVVLAQAAAAALPILTTTNCCGPDLIREGQTGWVLPIRSPGAFIVPPPLVRFAPGGTGCHDTPPVWPASTPHLGRRGHRFRIDLRGVSRSPWIPASYLNTCLSGWACMALLAVVRGRKDTPSVGLTLAYLLNLSLIHWMGAAIYLLPAFQNHDSRLTELGFEQTVYGVAAFAFGALVFTPASGQPRVPQPGARRDRAAAVDRRLPMAYIAAGVIFFLLSSTFLGQLPSAMAIVSTGEQLVVAGLCLCCWRAWQEGDFRKLAGWLCWRC